MKIQLPKILEKYIEASNEKDVKKFVSCFASSAIVHDEGELRTGIDQISEWFLKTRSKYNFTTEALQCEESKDGVVLTAKVTGTFPGSPINLRYNFKMQSGLIEQLRIVQ